MVKCLKCLKEFEPKRSTAKFCSNKCRAAYNRGDKKAKELDQLSRLYNSVLTAVNAINARNGQPPALCDVFAPETPKEALLSYNELKALVLASTSETQLKAAWVEVSKAELAGWQLRQLTQLKEDQQTKLDF